MPVNLRAVGGFVLSALVQALQTACLKVFQARGVIELDGKPIQIWISEWWKQKLEKEIYSLQDENPGLAASIQERLDKAENT